MVIFGFLERKNCQHYAQDVIVLTGTNQDKMKENKEKRVEDFIKDYLDVSDDAETYEMIEAKLNNLNFARVFLCLYYLKLQSIQYQRTLFAKRAKVSPTNLPHYLNYFINQGFAKIIPITHGSKRNSMVKACNNEANKDAWERLIKVAIKTITDKEKIQEEKRI